MRIGIDASALSKEIAGIGNYCLQIITRIYKLDQENEYFLFAPTDIELPIEMNDHWHFINYGGPKAKTLRYMTALPGILKKNKIEVFVGTRHYLPPFNSDIKYIGVVHDLIPLYMPELFTKGHKARFSFFTNLCAKKADCIIAVSEATKADVMKYMHLPEEKISMIYEGANERFSTERDEEGIKQTMEKYNITRPYVLCLSTVEPRKNMLRTIQAFETFLRDSSSDFDLVIVGGKGWNNGEIFEYAKRPGLADHVIFTGYAENTEIKHIYANAAVFVYASLCEGFGIPIVEAMQSGIPVITSNVSCMPEVAGDAGILVDPYSVENISDAIYRVCSNKALQEKMKKDGPVQASKFSWDKCAAAVHDVIINI